MARTFMDPALRIQILAGPQAGLQITCAEPRLTFGRGEENGLVIPVPHLSRLHGELLLREEGWVVLHQSANGLRVNRRKVTPHSPHVLTRGVVVGVGGTRLFSVHFTPSGVGGKEAKEDAQAAPERRQFSRRARVYIGIGLFWAVCIIVGIVAALMRPSNGVVRTTVKPLPAEEITEEIRRPLTRVLDEREATRHLADAHALYERIGAAPDVLYKVHRHYRLSMAFSGRKVLEGIDQLRFDEVELKLVERVTTGYMDAYARMRSGDLNEAERLFFVLTQVYPDTYSMIHRNVQGQLQAIRESRPKRRFR